MRLAAGGELVGAAAQGAEEGEMARGGARERGPAPYAGEGEWLHADARLGQDAKVERCAAIASGRAA